MLSLISFLATYCVDKHHGTKEMAHGKEFDIRQSPHLLSFEAVM
jgi:hypothetical protein